MADEFSGLLDILRILNFLDIVQQLRIGQLNVAVAISSEILLECELTRLSLAEVTSILVLLYLKLEIHTAIQLYLPEQSTIRLS